MWYFFDLSSVIELWISPVYLLFPICMMAEVLSRLFLLSVSVCLMLKNCVLHWDCQLCTVYMIVAQRVRIYWIRYVFNVVNMYVYTELKVHFQSSGWIEKEREKERKADRVLDVQSQSCSTN